MTDTNVVLLSAVERLIIENERPFHEEDLVYLSHSDADLLGIDYMVIALAGCTLDMHPDKTNWVQDGGGLPQYICEIARAILRDEATGGAIPTKSVSRAIAIAVGRVKRWATGVGVKADTQAKAVAAVAQWEALKAKAHIKSAVKDVARGATTAARAASRSSKSKD